MKKIFTCGRRVLEDTKELSFRIRWNYLRREEKTASEQMYLECQIKMSRFVIYAKEKERRDHEER
jgi:hypothetical protein